MPNFNPEQSKAIAVIKGMICIIAGAGSGKTATLIERIAQMVKTIPANRILAFTFTKKAATEMKERLQDRLGPEANTVTVGTIHGVFYSILREWLPKFSPKYRSFGTNTLIKDWQQKKIMREIHQDFHFNNPDYCDEKEALRRIGVAKNLGFLPDGYFDYLEENDVEQEQIHYWTTCYREYEERKAKESKLDFDDMLLMTRELLRSQPTVLAACRAKWQYISVDEFQDINPVQEECIDLLQTGNLFAVGDPRQSIYAFRGSQPKFIIEFAAKYPEAQIIELPRNYRCGSKILEKANKLIAHNDEGRVPMIAEAGFEGSVKLMPPFANAEDEGAGIGEAIANADGLEWENQAVLYRCGYQSRAIEDAMIRLKIPYEIVGSEGFYGRSEIKDMIAYMRIAHDWNEASPEYLERIYSKPVRYIGKKWLGEWHSKGGNMDALTASYSSLNRRNAPNVQLLHQDLTTLRKNYLDNPSGFINFIRGEMGYDKWFVENRGEEGNENEVEILGNLTELTTSATNFLNITDLLKYIDEVTAEYAKEGGNRVKLMTLHRAKGLEFESVYLSGVNDQLLPHARSTDLTEERRLMYVGTTRAKSQLTLAFSLTVRDRAADPSPFLFEMGVEPEIDLLDENITQGARDYTEADTDEGFRSYLDEKVK